DVSKETALAQLHAFESLIMLNPLVVSFERLNCCLNDPRSYCYKIVDGLKVLGMTFPQTYTANIILLDDGASVSIKASLGVSTTSRWVVEECGMKRVIISEASKVECPRILQSYVISQIKSSHLVLIRELCKKLKSK